MRSFLLPVLVAAVAAGCGTAEPDPTCPVTETQREVIAAEAMRLRYEALFLTQGVSTGSHFGGGAQLLDHDGGWTGVRMVTGGCSSPEDWPESCEPAGPEGAQRCWTLHCEGAGNATVHYRWAPDELAYTSVRGLLVRYKGTPALHFTRTATAGGFEDRWTSATEVHVEAGGTTFDLSGSVEGSSVGGTLIEVVGRYTALLPGHEIRLVVGPGAMLGEPDGQVLFDGEKIGAFPLVVDSGVYWSADGCLDF